MLHEGILTENFQVDEKIDHIASSLRDRMRFYKLRIVQNASLLAANFNGLVEGEEAPSTDSERLLGTEDVLVGERVRHSVFDAFVRG